MNILFMGSPEFSIPTLNALSEEHDFDIVGVFTQPDRPAGRGRKLRASPVKLRSNELGLSIYQPTSLKSPEIISTVHALNPDLIVVSAYGMILPPDILAIPVFGSINLHASLLPRWRGAAPIQAAIHAGDPKTGVTIMKMDPGLDTGPILSKRHTVIHSSDTGGELSDRLAKLGAELLIESIPGYLSGELQPNEQDEKMATYAPLLKKSDGHLDFMRSAIDLERQVRAYEPWPASFFEWGNRRVIIRKADALTDSTLAPGTVGQIENNPAIGANPGTLLLQIVQPAGKNEMGADDFLRGAGGILHTTLLANRA
ncbi:MAG: methionyl-tRNA formyltransferase [Anaerolineales bacterium]|nr:methionyl-tRNA formyltransferase [Anaerolineales bacterium]